LDALNRFDNPMRRRAASVRENSLLRRDIDPIRGSRMRDIKSDLAGSMPGRPHTEQPTTSFARQANHSACVASAVQPFAQK
jgi:hypothetical protein